MPIAPGGGRLEKILECSVHDLTVFKLHFGKLTLKMYDKGERVLRIEIIVNNVQELRCGKRLEKLPAMRERLEQMVVKIATDQDSDAQVPSGLSEKIDSHAKTQRLLITRWCCRFCTFASWRESLRRLGDRLPHPSVEQIATNKVGKPTATPMP
jgi:hypothetical protein